MANTTNNSTQGSAGCAIYGVLAVTERVYWKLWPIDFVFRVTGAMFPRNPHRELLQKISPQTLSLHFHVDLQSCIDKM